MPRFCSLVTASHTPQAIELAGPLFFAAGGVPDDESDSAGGASRLTSFRFCDGKLTKLGEMPIGKGTTRLLAVDL